MERRLALTHSSPRCCIGRVMVGIERLSIFSVRFVHCSRSNVRLKWNSLGHRVQICELLNGEEMKMQRWEV